MCFSLHDFSIFSLAGVEGLEPPSTVLETVMLPLHHTPKKGPLFIVQEGPVGLIKITEKIEREVKAYASSGIEPETLNLEGLCSTI